MQTTDITVVTGAVIELAHEAQNESKEEHQADNDFLKRGVNSDSEELDAQDHEVLATMRDTAGHDRMDDQENLEESYMNFLEEAEDFDYDIDAGKLNENNGSDGDNDITLMEAEVDLDNDLTEDQYTDISIDGATMNEAEDMDMDDDSTMHEAEDIAELEEAEADLDADNLSEDQFLDVSIDGSSIEECNGR